MNASIIGNPGYPVTDKEGIANVLFFANNGAGEQIVHVQSFGSPVHPASLEFTKDEEWQGTYVYAYTDEVRNTLVYVKPLPDDQKIKPSGDEHRLELHPSVLNSVTEALPDPRDVNAPVVSTRIGRPTLGERSTRTLD